MSRTNKDMPHWVRAEVWKPDHRCSEYGYRRLRFWPDGFGGGGSGCDLPDFERKDTRWVRLPKQWRLSSHCTWQPVWDRRSRVSAPPKWFVDHVWNNAERRRERDSLGKMRRDYNTNGMIDDPDFGCWQTRHSARWMWN